MSQSDVAEQTPDLARLGNVVPEGYEYRQKLTTPGEDLRLPNAWLKWYDLRFPEVEITPEQTAEARAFLTAEVAAGRLKVGGDLGFVLLHRAGLVLLLLVSTWRNTNEIWESVYVKEVEQEGAPGGEYAPVDFETTHRATFCVWELAAVWHERNAWVRFLASARDEAAKRAYLADRFSGLA